MVTCQGKCNFDRLNATEWSETVESVEKSEILPPFPQQNDDGGGEKKKPANFAVIVEKTAADAKGRHGDKRRRDSI